MMYASAAMLTADKSAHGNNDVAGSYNQVAADEIDQYLKEVELQDHQFAELREVAADFSRRSTSLQSLREHVLLLRSRARDQWNQCQDYQRFVEDSQHAFAKAASEGTDSNQLTKLHEQVLSDHQAHNELCNQFIRMEAEIGDLEFSLGEKEAAVGSMARSMSRLLGDLGFHDPSDFVSAIESRPISPSEGHSSTDLHPLLQEYFDKAGDLNVFYERLGEVDSEFEDARLHMHHEQEQDRPVGISEAELESLYQHERSQIVAELETSSKLVEAAKVACLQEGLDPDNFRDRNAGKRSLDQPRFEESPDESPTPSTDQEVFPVLVQTTAETESLNLHNQRFPPGGDSAPPISDRIQNWVEGIELQDATANKRFVGRSLSASWGPGSSAFQEGLQNLSIEDAPASTAPGVGRAYSEGDADKTTVTHLVSNSGMYNNTKVVQASHVISHEEPQDLTTETPPNDTEISATPSRPPAPATISASKGLSIDFSEVHQIIVDNHEDSNKQQEVAKEHVSSVSPQDALSFSGRQEGPVKDERLRVEDFKGADARETFFVKGKVFFVLMNKPGTDTSQTLTTGRAWTTHAHGGQIFSKVRRFVVVEEGRGICTAIPILTYNGRGVAAESVQKSNHSIIYTGKKIPKKGTDEIAKRGEDGMRPPIRVEPDERIDKLDPKSRVDFSSPYKIAHSCRVRSFGMVHSDSMASLIYQFRAVDGQGTLRRRSLVAELDSGPGSIVSEGVQSQHRAAYDAVYKMQQDKVAGSRLKGLSKEAPLDGETGGSNRKPSTGEQLNWIVDNVLS